MALGYLFLGFIGMSTLALAGIIALFILKEGTVYNTILILLTVFSLLIAFLSANAQPINFTTARIIVWAIGLVSIVGLGMHFISKKPLIASRLLISASVVLGIYKLFF